MATAFDPERRSLLNRLGLLMLAPSLSSQIESAPIESVALDHATSRAARFQEFLRMRTAADGAPVLWVYSGVLVVKPDGAVARPVASIKGLSRSQATDQGDGRWLWTLDEAGYFCDLDTGRVAERILNPFTGEWVSPKHYRSPQRLLFSEQGITAADALPPGVEFRGEITELARLAGTVALTEDLYVKLPGSLGADGRAVRPARVAASLATFTTREAQLLQSESAWIDCQFNYTTLNSFVGWLGMDGQSGVQDMRLVGVKIPIDAEQRIPPALRQRIRVEHADLLR